MLILYAAVRPPVQGPPATGSRTGPVARGAPSQVQRVVLTSSVAAVAYGRELGPDYVYAESDWSDADNVDAYTRSKTVAERAAWDFVAQNEGHKFTLTTINPSLVVGPLLGSPGTSVGIIADMLNGKLPMYAPLQFGVVDVRDVARAHVLAIKSDKAPGNRCTTLQPPPRVPVNNAAPLLWGGGGSLRSCGPCMAAAQSVPLRAHCLCLLSELPTGILAFNFDRKVPIVL